MTKLNIAFLQLLPGKNLREQEKIGLEACQVAKNKGADIALFPEMWSTGYQIPQNKAKLDRLAISPQSEFTRSFAKEAKRLDMAIALSFLKKNDPAPQDSVVLFDRHGQRVLAYDKVHTCDFGDERMLMHGKHFYVTNLDTKFGPVKVGCMICFDREFPESGRILMLEGAELILVLNACPMEINRLSELRGCAFENMCAIATANYPVGKPNCNGHSTLFDGVAYLPNLPHSRDMKIFEASPKAGIYTARLDIDLLRQYRATEVHGNAYRRPEAYQLLIDERIKPPFIRKDRKK